MNNSEISNNSIIYKISNKKKKLSKMIKIIIYSMNYILTETNYKNQYEDFKLELNGDGLEESEEKKMKLSYKNLSLIMHTKKQDYLKKQKKD